MSIEVRPMAAGDVAAVYRLGLACYDVSVSPYTSWSLTAISTHLEAGRSACLVAEDGAELAGFVLASMGFEGRDDWGYVEWLAVGARYRGRGIAQRLVPAACEALKRAGARRIVTDVAQENVASAAVMRRAGFAPGVTVVYFVQDVA